MLTKEQTEVYVTMDRWGVVYGKRGYAAGLITLGAELYVEPRDRQTLRLAMLDVQEDYYQRFHENLNEMCYYSEKEEDGKLVTLEKGENPIPWVRDDMGQIYTQAEYSNDIYMAGYRHPDFPDARKFDITPWQSGFLVSSETGSRRNDLSYYASSIPVSNGQGQLHIDLWRDSVLAWAKILRPAHGIAGLTVLMSDITTDGPFIYPFLKKYPGLDVQMAPDFSMLAEGIFNRIKCVNWLTVLGDAVLDELGGLSAIQHELASTCTLYPYPGGLMIQAGEIPQLGDMGNPAAYGLLTPYRKVAAITQPVRFMDYEGSLFCVNSPVEGAEEARKWVSRFD